MRNLGLSFTLLVAAAPAWGQQPLPVAEPAIPAPAGYPAPNTPPGAYPYSPPFRLTGGEAPPDVLPPGAPPMGSHPAALQTQIPGAGPPALECDGYPCDPCFEYQRRSKPVVPSECWVKGDWLYWSFRNVPVPPLIVTGNPALPGAAIPGGGNITPLVGPSRDLGAFSGARLTLGRWFDPDGELGWEASGFIFGRNGSADYFYGSPARVLSVPVIGTTGGPAAYDFSFPDRFAGNLGVTTSSRLLGAEGLLLHRWYGNGCLSFDSLFGYRFLLLNESLNLLGRTQSAGALATFGGQNLPAGVVVTTSDSFRTQTQFHGIELGGRLEGRRDMFTVTVWGKGAAGINVYTLRTEGNTTASGFDITKSLPGGVRALPSNFGRDTNTDFSLVGETGIELGLQATKHVSIRVGYNLLFWTNVLRPGNVISPVVTLSQVPIDPGYSATPVPNAQPVPTFRTSDFLAQGLTLGAVVDW